MQDPTDVTHPSTTAPSKPYRRPGQVTLRVITGPNAGDKIVASKDRVIVGRSRTADLTIDHPSVSAIHFELSFGAHGLELRDLNSTNGTQIGRVPVFHATVQPGMVISAGDCDVKLETVGDIEVELVDQGHLGPMIGSSPIMQETFAKIRRFAQTPLDVFITGETGTGKELAARAVHDLSSRRNGPYVTLDCGTLARNLIEGALFGYKKGAFTGAESDSAGFVEQANNGTLFIDELGELPNDLQVKLLRLLDRRQVVRLGETTPREVDMRVVTATNRDLERMVAEGQFREDLYHRLSQARVELPPLRRRGQDVIKLAEARIEQVSKERNLPITLSRAAEATLLRHTWPGNVRELFNAIDQAAHVTQSGTISKVQAGAPATTEGLEHLCSLPFKDAQEGLTKIYLARALKRSGGSVAACARQIGLPRTSLRRKLSKLPDLCYVDEGGE